MHKWEIWVSNPRCSVPICGAWFTLPMPPFVPILYAMHGLVCLWHPLSNLVWTLLRNRSTGLVLPNDICCIIQLSATKDEEDLGLALDNLHEPSWRSDIYHLIPSKLGATWQLGMSSPPSLTYPTRAKPIINSQTHVKRTLGSILTFGNLEKLRKWHRSKSPCPLFYIVQPFVRVQMNHGYENNGFDCYFLLTAWRGFLLIYHNSHSCTHMWSLMTQRKFSISKAKLR